MRRRISPSMAVALVALFFAMTGAGVAATGFRITSLRQIAPSVRHALRGRPGPRGPQGIAGPQGPQGPAGATGVAGVSPAIHWDGDYSVTGGAELCSPPQDSPAGQAPFHCGPTADVIIDCQPGDHVLSGDVQGKDEIVTTDQLLAAQGLDDGTVSGRGWEVVAHLDPTTPSGTRGNVQTTVLCLRSG